jgi:hypothetical protein
MKIADFSESVILILGAVTTSSLTQKYPGTQAVGWLRAHNSLRKTSCLELQQKKKGSELFFLNMLRMIK